MSICLTSSPGPPMQGNTNNYSGGAAVSAVPSMAKNDPSSTSSNVCKVNLSCFSRTFSVYFYLYVCSIYSGTSIYRFSRGWRNKTMNAGKRLIRETVTIVNK